MKKCPKCETEKPYSSFHKSNHSKDGYYSYCKECARQYRKRYYPKVHKPRGKQRQTKNNKLLCSKCLKYLPPESFYNSSKSKTGRVSQCRKCSYAPKLKIDTSQFGRCTYCNKVQPLDQFRPAQNKRGHSCRCMSCLNSQTIDCGTLTTKQCKRYTYYFTRASKKDMLFTLSPDDFVALISSPCKYCGTNNSIGIDRFDNNQGYTTTNCVPCCSTCNMFKYTMTYEQFIKHALAIVGHLKLS